MASDSTSRSRSKRGPQQSAAATPKPRAGAPTRARTKAPAVASASAGEPRGPFRVAVIGGAGAMGRITVRDLVETAPPGTEIVVADFDERAARALAASYGHKRVRAVKVDVRDTAASARALEGCFALLNSTHHRLNLAVMDVALAARAHYVDLGGLFHETRKQLKLDAAFRRAGRLAILGMGAAPGIVNVLARSAADTLDRVDEIHVKVGNVDRTPGRPSTPLGTSYSLETILEEASAPAALFTGGKFTFVPAMSGVEAVRFPAPVGLRHPAYTLHSEVATLPLSFAKKGVREVSFRIAFSDELDARVRFLTALGLNDLQPLRVPTVGGEAVEIVPQRVLLAAHARLPKVPFDGVPDEYEVLRVVVRGEADGRAVEETVDCHTPGLPQWGYGVDVDTGCPPSIVAQLMWRGDLDATGVRAPEVAVPCAPFFAELGKRRMRVRRKRVVQTRA